MTRPTDDEVIDRLCDFLSDLLERDSEGIVQRLIRQGGLSEDEIVMDSELLGRIAGRLIIQFRTQLGEVFDAARAESQRPASLPAWPAPIPMRNYRSVE